MASEVKVPTLGESVTEGTIGEWLKQPGDPVKVDEPIASLETDKVAVEVPSPVAGVIGELKAAVGDTVEVGAVIATVDDDVAAGESTKVAPREQDEAPAHKPAPAAAKDAPAGDAQTLSPAVRRAVRAGGERRGGDRPRGHGAGLCGP